MDKGAFYVLLDGEDRIVYTDGASVEEEAKLQELLWKEGAGGVLSGEKGVVSLLLEDRTYLVSFAESETNGWTYLYFNPLTNINESIHAITWLVLFVMALTAILAVIAAVVLYHYLNTPIGRLSKAMANMEKGILETRVDIPRRDELGQLEMALIRCRKNQEFNQRYRERAEREKKGGNSFPSGTDHSSFPL